MEKLRNIVRQVLTTSLSNREIAHACSVSRNTVKRYRSIATDEGFNWLNLTGLADDQFNALFNGSGERLSRKRRPDYSLIHAEKQTKGVTLLLLWEEYCLEDSSSALSYSHFTESYRRYVSSIERVMRQVHLPGKKLFVDFSGKKPYFIDQETGEKVEVELFVGVLGYSNYTFACAALSQS